MGSKKKKSKKTMVADWSNLQADLLELIAKRLQITDLVRMKAICRRWRSVVEERAYFINTSLVHTNKTQLPWLLFPPGTSNGSSYDSRVCRFYSLTDNTTTNNRFLMPKDAVAYKSSPHICGSSYGWLVISRTGDLINPSLFLVNPLANKHIALPLVKPSPFCYFILNRRKVHKVILSGTPSSSVGDNNNWMAIVMYGDSRNLAFVQPGEERWTSIALETNTSTNGAHGSYDDMVIWKEKLHVISHGTVNLGVCNMENWKNDDDLHSLRWYLSDQRIPKMKIFELEIPQDYPHPYLTTNYLVVSSSGNDLLLVCREVKNLDYKDGHFYYRTSSFCVYKLEIEGTVWKWKKIETILENETIFLGINQSVCLPASAECEANCIYYTDDLKERHTQGEVGGHDVGIFNIVTRKFKSLPSCPRSDAWFIWPPPLWFRPSLL